MKLLSPGRCVALAALSLWFVSAVSAETRTWRDASGKFSVEAEFVAIDDGQVRLLRADNGEEVTLPLARLSDEDRAFVRKLLAKKPASADEAQKAAIAEIAERFYRDLRTKERDEARAALTDKAQEVNQGERSPLATLPTPDEYDKAIRLGKVRIEGSHAEAPVIVRVDGKPQKTALHFRMENDLWRVFGLSATFPDGEQSIDFEAPPLAAGAATPLASLMGQPLELAGLSLDGRPLDMSQYRGKVVLVDFWATWCGPCRAEMPNILAAWRQFNESGFDVIGISVDTDLDDLRKFVVAQNPPWAVVADRHPQNPVSMSAKYRVSSFPTMLLLDREGRVASLNCRGPLLAQEVAKLLAAQGGPPARGKNRTGDE